MPSAQRSSRVSHVFYFFLCNRKYSCIYWVYVWIGLIDSKNINDFFLLFFFSLRILRSTFGVANTYARTFQSLVQTSIVLSSEQIRRFSNTTYCNVHLHANSIFYEQSNFGNKKTNSLRVDVLRRYLGSSSDWFHHRCRINGTGLCEFDRL